MGSVGRLGTWMRALSCGALLALAAAQGAGAQGAGAFVQVEAHPSLAEAQAAARRYAGANASVGGFAMPGGWYAVALGPFEGGAARERLARLRAEGRIPADSFVTDGERYGSQFWPVGAALRGAAPEPARPGETAAEARRGEAALAAPERRRVQAALREAGLYAGAIDGDFGPATRRAVAAWQDAGGRPATGALTGAERGELMADYEALFAGLDMEAVINAAAGIAIEMPAALVAFGGVDFPFASYGPRPDAPEGLEAVRVTLISREGDARALAGLQGGLRALGMVPPGEPAAPERDAFSIEGAGGGVHARAHARLENGRIKGFVLAWPEGDGARMERVFARMAASLRAASPAALGPADGAPAAARSLDALRGLEVRRPLLARSGTFVSAGGAVLTTAEVTGGGCGRVLIDDVHPARVAFSDGRVALLLPEAPLAPPAVAALAEAPGRPGDEIAVAGFPFGAALGRASLAFGVLEDAGGRAGEGTAVRYALEAEAGDAGGPVLNASGALAGMLLAADAGGAALGVGAEALAAALQGGGIEPRLAAPGAPLSPEALDAAGAAVAVLVTCYE